MLTEGSTGFVPISGLFPNVAAVIMGSVLSAPALDIEGLLPRNLWPARIPHHRGHPSERAPDCRRRQWRGPPSSQQDPQGIS
jgi:hypothetical protein